MIWEVIILAFSWHFFQWFFRVLLITVIGAKVSNAKESLLEQVKDIKGAKKEHDNATADTNW